MVEWKRGEVTM